MKIKAQRDTCQRHHARQLPSTQYSNLMNVAAGVFRLAAQCRVLVLGQWPVTAKSIPPGRASHSDAALLVVAIVPTMPPPRALPQSAMHHPDQYRFGCYRPLARVGLGQHCFASRIAVFFQGMAHVRINIADNSSRKQGCIDSSRLADSQRAHRDAGGHLRDGKE